MDTAAYKKASRSDLPDVHSLDEVQAQVLFILEVAKRAGAEWITAGDVAVFARDVEEIVISQELSRYHLMALKKRRCISEKTLKSRRHYQIVKKGRDELGALVGNILHIDPSAGFSGRKNAEYIFNSLTGDVSICDPYVDPQTLYLISSFSGAKSIRILTQKLDKEKQLKTDLSLLEKEMAISIEIRAISGRKLHDRYILSGEGVTLIGTSLNYLGKKQTFVVSVGSILLDSVRDFFEQEWAGALAI